MKRKLAVLFLAAAAVLFFAGCSKSANQNASLPKVMAAMKQKITNTQMMDLSESDLMTNYGIQQGDVRQFSAYVDSTGTKGDEIVLMQGKDLKAAERIKEKLDGRYKQKETEMKDYLPEEYAVLKKCRVRQDADYVSLIVSPQYEELEKIYCNAIGIS